jgi:cobalt-zinc-cadmium efflux system protein
MTAAGSPAPAPSREPAAAQRAARHAHPPDRGPGHGHSHGHGHGHGHVHTARNPADAATARRRLAWTLALVGIYMVAEVVGGLLTNSLALLADAGHMLSDAGALALSWFALWIVHERPPARARTYGAYRAEILAALANGATLVAIAGWIAVEAVQRLREPPEVYAPGLFAVACGGLLVNLVALGLLHGFRGASLNLRGAWLHVATDALGSAQAIAAGALLWAFGWRWVDPVASLLIAALVVWSAWGLLAEAVAVLMESAPGHIDVDEVRAVLLGVEGVEGVHDLHVWSIASGFDCLSAHVVTSVVHDRDDLLATLRGVLHERFGVDHVTLQLEPAGFVEGPCC